MKTWQKTTLAIITAGTLALGATAYAKRGDSFGSHMVSRIADRLNLDDNQTQALDALRVEVEETRQLMRGDGNELAEQVQSLVDAETFDQGAALTLLNDRANAFQNNAPELVAAAAVFFDGLDAEQKSKVSSAVDRFGQRRGGFGHRGRHGHSDSE